MLSPRTRLFAILVFVLASVLVLEPLPVLAGAPGSGIHLDFSTPLRAIESVVSVVPHALAAVGRGLVNLPGRLFGGRASAAAPVPTPSPSPSQLAPPDGPGELVAMRSQDGSFYRNGDGSTRAVFEHHKHFLAAPGRWENVDLNFHASGADFVADKNDVIVKVTGKSIQTTERTSGKGIVWTLPVKPVVLGNRASFSGQQGLSWSYYTTSSGVKLVASVAEPFGPRTYVFPYQLVGGAQPLRNPPTILRHFRS